MAVLKTITIDGVQYQLIQKADDESLGGIKTGFTPDYNDSSFTKDANKKYYGIKLNDSAKAYIEIDKKDLNAIDKPDVSLDTNIITPKDDTIFVYNSLITTLPPTAITEATSLILNLSGSTLNIGKTCTVIANNIEEIKIGTLFEYNSGDGNKNNLIKNNVYWEGTQIENVPNDNTSKYKIDITRLTGSSPANPIGEFIISKSKYINTASN
jgi:hypothetical protein